MISVAVRATHSAKTPETQDQTQREREIVRSERERDRSRHRADRRRSWSRSTHRAIAIARSFDRDRAKLRSRSRSRRSRSRSHRSRSRSHRSRSRLRLSGFDDFFQGFVCVLRNEWYYIFVWWSRKYEKMWATSRKCVFYGIFKNTTKHQKIFFKIFFEMQPNTWKYFTFWKIFYGNQTQPLTIMKREN